MAGCRFVVSDFDEGEASGEVGEYAEAILNIEIDGKMIFEQSLHAPLLVTFQEHILPDSLSMIRNIDWGHPDDEFEIFILGTGYAIMLVRDGSELEVRVDSDSLAPPRPVGRIAVRDWVSAVASLGTDVLERFRLLNPRVYAAHGKTREGVRRLEAWLSRHAA